MIQQKLFKMDRCRGEPYVSHVLDIPYDNSQSDNSDASKNTNNVFKSHSSWSNSKDRKKM